MLKITKELNGCVYKIKSIKFPNKIYIGSTVVFDKRKKRHIKDLKSGKHHNILLQRHYNKYGFDDFIFEIIEQLINPYNLISKEQFYLDSLKPVFNILKIANSPLGIKRSEETKKKLSLANKGVKKPRTKEHQKKLNQLMTGKKKRT